METNSRKRSMRGKRVIVHTVIGYVITRFMREKGLTFQQVSEGTGICKSALHGWANGVCPENPDMLIPLRKYFSEVLRREISTDDLLYGKDEDRQAMKLRIEELERENKSLECQLAMFEICERNS